MQSTEKWLPVPGHEEDYAVSDQGRVWSHISGRILRGSKRKRGGHLVVNLRGKQWRIHQLAMLAFIGPCPPGMEVCHGDGDPENNALANLRYDTHRANVGDRRRHGTHPRGVDLRVATRFTEHDVRQIRQHHADGLSYANIASLYGIRDRHHIKKIVKRKIWAWVDDPALEYQSRAHAVPTIPADAGPSHPNATQRFTPEIRTPNPSPAPLDDHADLRGHEPGAAPRHGTQAPGLS